MIDLMADEEPGPVTAGEKIMAAALIVLAVGVLFIGADLLSGGRLTGTARMAEGAADEHHP